MGNNNPGASDKAKGTISKVKGELKDQFGNATDDKKIQSEGKKDKIKGSMQHATGEAKDNNKEN